MRVVRIMHKWLGLIVGLQLLMWTVSGLMFSWLDHHEVSAEHSVRIPRKAELPDSEPVVEPAVWLDDYAAANVLDITLEPLLEHWVYRIRLNDRVELRRASDGKPFEIDAALIRRLAQTRYAGTGTLRTVALQTRPTLETRDSGPVWRASFDDDDGTSLYFSAADGRFVAARNDTWRLFDFFWMLHTMDYRGRDNFNNPLVITAASGALWLGISGVLLLFRSFRPGEINLLARWQGRAQRPSD